MLWFKNRRELSKNSCPASDHQKAIGVNIDRNWYEMSDNTYSGPGRSNYFFLNNIILSDSKTWGLFQQGPN